MRVYFLDLFHWGPRQLVLPVIPRTKIHCSAFLPHGRVLVAPNCVDCLHFLAIVNAVLAGQRSRVNCGDSLDVHGVGAVGCLHPILLAGARSFLRVWCKFLGSPGVPQK